MISLDRGLLGAGGSGDVLERHKKYADRAGHLDIIVFAGPKYSESQAAPNLRIFPTRSSKLSHFQKAVKIALNLNRDQPYNLLVTQEFTAPAGLKIKKILNLPWIINIHSMFFTRQWLGFNPIAWYLLFLIRKAVRHADGFRVNNNDIRNKLLQWKIQKPILVQPTPIDITRFKIKDLRFKNNNSRVKVLYVGRLSAEKNAGLLIRAFKNLKGDYELQIVGKGQGENELKRFAADDLRIYFLGQRSSDELPEIFRSADIFVLSSNTESFGQVLLQAAAAGCAIIATATPGAKTILDNPESGILVPIGDQKALERALTNFLTKRFEREYWSQKAREMADKYDAAAGLDRTLMFWQEVANAKNTKGNAKNAK